MQIRTHTLFWTGVKESILAQIRIFHYFNSITKTADGIKVIDPEFCFFGPVEFENGMMVAYLKMADQREEVNDRALSLYRAISALIPVCNRNSLVLKYCDGFWDWLSFSSRSIWEREKSWWKHVGLRTNYSF